MGDIIPIRPARLEPKPGFAWAKVKWGGPRDPVAEECSYCGSAFAEDEVPLRLMGRRRFAAFCERCQAEWWGLERVEEDPDA